MKTRKSTSLTAFLIIFLMMFIALCLTSCDGDTFSYEVTGSYYMEGTDKEFTATEVFSWSPNSTVKSAVAEPYWKVTHDGHCLEMCVDWNSNKYHGYSEHRVVYTGPLVVAPDKITAKKINSKK